MIAETTSENDESRWRLPAFQGICIGLLFTSMGAEFIQDSLTASYGEQGRDWSAANSISMELLVVLVLTISFVAMVRIFHGFSQRHIRSEEVLRTVSGSFFEHIQQKFQDWQLTPSERDVALLSIKGLTISDIAELRDTKSGTIKAQCVSIYRKAGVGGQPQFLSLFLEELIALDVGGCKEPNESSGDTTMVSQ